MALFSVLWNNLGFTQCDSPCFPKGWWQDAFCVHISRKCVHRVSKCLSLGAPCPRKHQSMFIVMLHVPDCTWPPAPSCPWHGNVTLLYFLDCSMRFKPTLVSPFQLLVSNSEHSVSTLNNKHTHQNPSALYPACAAVVRAGLRLQT